MEVKVNQEIRNYKEHIFFGLSFRQLLFSILACITSVFAYFLLKDKIGLEAASWVCIFSALPFIIIGYITYNDMPAEKFIWCWIKSQILIPKHLEYKPINFYYELMKEGDISNEKTKRIKIKR